MQGMLEEIREIPEKAELCYSKTRDLKLPENIPYIGMGSSYFAPMALKFIGKKLQPEMASEYFSYISKKKQPEAVLISQSGRSSETLWCRELFDRYTAIVNEINSPLAENAATVVPIWAGKEEYSSTKTYVNTLIALYNGFGTDPKLAIDTIKNKISDYEILGKKIAAEISEKLGQAKSFYVIANGPNIATAYEAALTMGETTKLAINGMPAAQYDHGPKETAKDSLVIAVNVKGPSYDRTKKLIEKIRKAGAHVFVIEEIQLSEELSPIALIVPINFLTYYLAKKLGLKKTFEIGSKVTEVELNQH